MSAPSLVLLRRRIGQPVRSHGGAAALLGWTLLLNDVAVANEGYRVLWDNRDNPKNEPPPEVVRLMRALEKALGITTVRATEKEFNAHF